MCKSIISTLYVKVNISCPTLQLQPKTRNKTRGQPRLSVTYPKYKEGEATVREARVPASYGDYATIGTCTTTDTNNTDYQSTMSSGTSIIQSLILYYIWDQLFPFWFSRNLIIKESYPLDPRALNNIIMLKKVCLPVLEYVTEIYQAMIITPRQELRQLAEKLKQQVP